MEGDRVLAILGTKTGHGRRSPPPADPTTGAAPYDHRERGESTDAPGPCGIDQFTDDAERVIGELD
ncbi:hypothetical protein ACFV2N_30960 [Streptomyces sp. NPDC059680]|uniref:hypothetical protein n=1 Tax=Streptomyces sp. NPDC059680 TaxID=3346904 RepID=UPI00367C2C5B